MSENIKNIKNIDIKSNLKKMSVSELIINRMRDSGVSFNANDNISEWIQPHEFILLKEELEQKMKGVFDSLLIDHSNDHNTKKTSKRITDMFFDEIFKGRYQASPKTTEFPNARSLNEVYTLGPIAIRSMCSHHFLPITGSVWVGVIPGDKVIGISKFNRVIEWVMSRPQIQEEAAIMIADELEKLITPKGVAIVIRAQHSCMTLRGVKDSGTSMTNSIMRGEFSKDNSKKREFFDLISSQGF
jgi:GTP cyclohydrolase I